MITFKENTFVKGTYYELMEMAKAIEEKGGKVTFNGNKNSNHLWWYKKGKSWNFDCDLYYRCDHELTKSQLYEAYGIVDFSILNDTDVFYVKLTDGRPWLFQGNNLIKEGKGVHIAINNDSIYTQDIMTSKSRIKSIRLATPQEIEPYKEHFKLNNMETRPKFKKGDTVRCIGEDVDITSAGWEKGKEFIVDEIALHDRPLYFPKNGAGVWEEHLELVTTTETRPIQISKETATRWYNGEDNELKQLAIQTFPELDEASPKVGDLCLFSDKIEHLRDFIGVIGILEKYNDVNEPVEIRTSTSWKYCKKIKSIEFYD